MTTMELNYQDGETRCRAFVAYPEDISLAVPAVMIAHDWGGRGEDACTKATELAKMGYIGFALDMYGSAQIAIEKVEKRALMTPLVNDRQKLLTRITAALDAVLDLPAVDKKKIAAIGYCFGGLCVLDLARSGAAVNAVVSFHGVLHAPAQGHARPIQSKILILHGYDDPLVKPEQVEQFATEMSLRRADWQAHLYGLTAHSFTNPLANDEEMGLHYNAQADKRSWKTTVDFLKEAFS